jgi:hypothetical protein
VRKKKMLVGEGVGFFCWGKGGDRELSNGFSTFEVVGGRESGYEEQQCNRRFDS